MRRLWWDRRPWLGSFGVGVLGRGRVAFLFIININKNINNIININSSSSGSIISILNNIINIDSIMILNSSISVCLVTGGMTLRTIC